MLADALPHRFGNAIIKKYFETRGQHADYNAPGTYAYEQFLRIILEMGLGYPALEQAFRRICFNIMAVNQDDHVKNIAFLMDDAGQWRLAPAYDLTHARGAGIHTSTSDDPWKQA